MTEAVRKLVEAARTTLCQTIDGASRLASAARAVESEAAREEAVERAIARSALEEVRDFVEDESTQTEDAEGNFVAFVVDKGETLSAIDRQLSLLSARNFEVVEIPQGEGCATCRFFHDGCFCSSPNAPSGRPSEERVFSYCERCRLTKDNCEECEHREPLRKEKRDE